MTRIFKKYWPRSMRIAPKLNKLPKNPRLARKHALLVHPFYPKDPNGSFGKHVLVPAQTMTSIAASTPEDWTVSFWDENLLQGPPPIEPFPSVVGITVHLTFAKRAYELARYYQKGGAKVILGGLHVNACPEEAAEHADAIALGNGVALWPAILRDVETGALQKWYTSGHGQNGQNGRKCHFRDEPLPRRDILDRRDYLSTASLISARGCKNRCDFCYLSTKNVASPRQARDAKQIAEDFQNCPEPYGVFIDNNLGARRSYLLELCRELEPLGKIWSAAVTIDVADDEKTLATMAAAGCTGVFVGLETLNEANLTDNNKRAIDPDNYSDQVRRFHDYGIQVNGSFVFGFDHDGPEVFDKTIEWIENNRLECATFHILTPYPGTPLFAKLEEEGRILHRDWSKYDTSQVVFKPRKMTVEQLEQGYQSCYERLFSHASILKRRPEGPSEWMPYLAMSYLYKNTNLLWPFVIRHRLTGALWAPLIRAAQQRFLRKRRLLIGESKRTWLLACPPSPYGLRRD